MVVWEPRESVIKRFFLNSLLLGGPRINVKKVNFVAKLNFIYVFKLSSFLYYAGDGVVVNMHPFCADDPSLNPTEAEVQFFYCKIIFWKRWKRGKDLL